MRSQVSHPLVGLWEKRPIHVYFKEQTANFCVVDLASAKICDASQYMPPFVLGSTKAIPVPAYGTFSISPARSDKEFLVQFVFPVYHICELIGHGLLHSPPPPTPTPLQKKKKKKIDK